MNFAQYPVNEAENLADNREKSKWNSLWSSIYLTLLFAVSIFVLLVKNVYGRDSFLERQILEKDPSLSGDYLGIAVATAVFLIVIGVYSVYLFFRFIEYVVETILIKYSMLVCHVRAVDVLFLVLSLCFSCTPASSMELPLHSFWWIIFPLSALVAFLSHFGNGFKDIARAFLVSLSVSLCVLLFI